MKLGTKKDHNVEMCILQGECCPMFFKGVRALGLRIFHAKYFVFATPPKPLGDFDETWYKERSQCGDVHIARGVLSDVFLKELGPLDLGFSMQNTLSSQLLLNPWGNFNET